MLEQEAEDTGSHPHRLKFRFDWFTVENDRRQWRHGCFRACRSRANVSGAASAARPLSKTEVQLGIDRQKRRCEAIFMDWTRTAPMRELIGYVDADPFEARAVADKFQDCTCPPLSDTPDGLRRSARVRNSDRDHRQRLACATYLTDLFPILDWHSAKNCCSIGKLTCEAVACFEDRCWLSSAPKTRASKLLRNHLRWDKLGEFCCVGGKPEVPRGKKDNVQTGIFGKAVGRRNPRNSGQQ